jgi:hypothetical protein
MYPALSLGTEGNFNLNSELADALRASGQMPDEQLVTLPGIKGGQKGFPAEPAERQVELARQLSTIFVIDQLLGQWDRFWGNLEASGDKSGRLKLIARDNGGATLDDWEDFKIYNNWVTRYDPAVIERLKALNAFLKGEAAQFSGFTNKETWKDAAGFIAASSFDAFCKKLALLLDERIPALIEQFGDKTFFPPKSPEAAKLDEADTGVDD